MEGMVCATDSGILDALAQMTSPKVSTHQSPPAVLRSFNFLHRNYPLQFRPSTTTP